MLRSFLPSFDDPGRKDPRVISRKALHFNRHFAAVSKKPSPQPRSTCGPHGIGKFQKGWTKASAATGTWSRALTTSPPSRAPSTGRLQCPPVSPDAPTHARFPTAAVKVDVTIEALKSQLAPEMTEVDRVLRASLDSDVVLIRQVAEYIVGGGGKRLRPALVLLSARA